MTAWLRTVAGSDRAEARVPAWLVRAMVAYLAAAVLLHLAWSATGHAVWMTAFRALTATFLVSMTMAAAAQAMAARACFSGTDPLRIVWTLLVVAALVRCAGHGVAGSALFSPPEAAAWVQQVGRVAAGPLYLLVVGVALSCVVRLYGRLGLLVRLTPLDFVPIAGVALFAWQFLRDLATWRAQASQQASALDVIGWTSDPLLALVLLAAVVIRRAAVHMGAGHVSRCWSAFAAGILLTSAGDVGLWAGAHGYVTWPWISLVWYVWPLAETAYALAPAWQLVACRTARQFESVPRRAAVARAPITAWPAAPYASTSSSASDSGA